MKIAILSCSSKKIDTLYPIEAYRLYSKSALFRLTLEYIRKQKYDRIFVLSAKYYIIGINENIENYNLTLNKFTMKQKKEWSKIVFERLISMINKDDVIDFYTGKNYYKYLLPLLKNYKVNIKLDQSIGKRLQYLKQEIKNE